MFTLSCKVNIFAKYLEEHLLIMVDSSNLRASCPYCGSKFKNNDELSTHIDRIHYGSGLLEGDSRKW